MPPALTSSPRARNGVPVVVFVLLTAACGSSTESSGSAPIVQIRSLTLNGDVATVVFDASDGPNPVDTVIDWATAPPPPGCGRPGRSRRSTCTTSMR